VKFIVDNWMLISIAIASGGLLMWPVVQGAAMTGLAPTGAVQLINREKAVVVDVCEPGEFAAGHVGGAKNVPLDQRWPSPRNWVTSRPNPWPAAWQPGKRLTFRWKKDKTMQAVKMYTTAVCPYCVQAKRVLKSKGVEHIEEVRIDANPDERMKMMEITGRRTVPQIFVGDTHVGGCDDLMALDSRGGLLPLLNAA